MLENTEAPFRYHEFLYERWNTLRGGRPFPTFAEWDMSSVAKIADYCFVAEVFNKAGKNGYNLVSRGAGISTTNEQNKEALDYLFSDQHMSFGMLLERVQVYGKPITESSEFVDSWNNIIRFRRCLLPMASETGVVGYVIGCVRWKRFDNRHGDGKKSSTWSDPNIF